MLEMVNNELMAYYFPAVYVGAYIPQRTNAISQQANSALNLSLNFQMQIAVTYSMNGYIYTQDY